jgi:hypothetical protein
MGSNAVETVSDAAGAVSDAVSSTVSDAADAIDRAERSFWLGFYDHYLPRKFINHYMDGSGDTITLTQQEMIDTYPGGLDIKKMKGFSNIVQKLKKKNCDVECCRDIYAIYDAHASQHGTLGRFSAHNEGKLCVRSSGEWTFTGKMKFKDEWNFDPQPLFKANDQGTMRSPGGEIKTRAANMLLRGKAFKIDSVWVDATQKSGQDQIQWAGSATSGSPSGSADDVTLESLSIGGVGGIFTEVTLPEVVEDVR